MTLITSVDAFSKSHPLWLCDIWGVVHDGITHFSHAVAALEKHRQSGGTVILISNSPRPKPQLIEQLDFLEVSAHAYDDVVSSGDVTRVHVEKRAGQKVYHLGPERDKGIFKGLDCNFTTPQEADYIVCSGLMDDTTETPEDYAVLLKYCAGRQLSMICANPDIQVQRGNSLVYCAGALAQAYGRLEGEVIYAGKPYLPIYDLAVELAAASGKKAGKEQILAIGDGVHTDAAGAANFGCDFLFIAGGLHKAQKEGGHELGESEASQLTKDILAHTPSLKIVGVSSVLA